MKTLKSPARLVACISTVLASWLALAALVHVGSKFPLHEAAIKGNFIEMIVHSDTELGLNERDFDGSMARLSRSNLQGLSESLNPHTVWSGLTGLVGSNKGWTALMYAAAYGHSSVIENMVAAGANVNLVDRDGNSALMIAIQTAQPEVATQSTELKPPFYSPVKDEACIGCCAGADFCP